MARPERREKEVRTGRVFSENNCARLNYRIKVSKGKFRLAEFARAFSRKGKFVEEGVVFSATCSTEDYESNDYHVGFQWSLRGDEIRLRVTYVRGSIPPKTNEGRPYAEGFMFWVGKFFRSERASTHIHASFEYSADEWRTFFPIPVIIGIGKPEMEVEFDGMSATLPGKPEGVAQAWLSAEEETIAVELAANRIVSFNRFNVQKELEALSSIAKRFIEEER